MKEVVKNAFLLIIGIILAIVLLEVFLSLYNPIGFRQKGDKIILPINFRMQIENKTIEGLDSNIVHTKNSIGFRGSEIPNNFEDWTSIVAVGGSTTECFYVSDGKDWPSLLGYKLNKEFGKIWINNAGLNGHSTFGHQILLDDYLVKIKPNYILFLIGCNDVGRDDLNAYEKNNLIQKKNWLKNLKNHSEIISLISNIRRNIVARKMGLEHKGVDFKKLEQVDSVSDKRIQQDSSYHSSFAGQFETRLKKLIRTTRKNGSIPILITQPTIVGFGIDEATLINLEKVKLCDEHGGKVYWRRLELYNEVTRKVANEEGVFLVDIAHKMPKSTDLFYDCFHFTNKGGEVLSELLFEEMKPFIAERLKQSRSNE